MTNPNISVFNIYIIAQYSIHCAERSIFVSSYDLKYLEEIVYNKAWLLLALKLHDTVLVQPALSEIPLSTCLKKTSC